MSANNRMSLAVHVLTWIAFDRGGSDKEVGASQRIASSVNTNPVVIRRSLIDLREAGLVEIFGMHASPPDAECYVGYGIQPVLTRVYDRVTAALCDSLATTTIADILRETMAEFEAGSGVEIPRGR